MGLSEWFKKLKRGVFGIWYVWAFELVNKKIMDMVIRVKDFMGQISGEKVQIGFIRGDLKYLKCYAELT